MMSARLLLLMVLVTAAQISCGGGTEGEPGLPQLEAPAPDSLQTSSWPDAVDLGVVVSSEVVPLLDPPAPPSEISR